ncbi:hypothetical protein JOC54_004111 [Alkalihalobacillus xiaoxiensis]|uniref:Uncharacterized protein n=1 Tax=Shouchella xiaoxiensis TaxID=766895 RepID=A0ABS2SZ76_9BACI|nr:hypothetical protein [Shouchella xiaoxiensis]MBM7840818.1 hypothetical protein [Shouchella xiaoxiensis]
MIKKLFYKKSPTNLTIKAIEAKLAEYGFSNGFTQEVGSVLAERKKEFDNDTLFQKWLTRLHYRLPEGFKSEGKAAQLYDQYKIEIDHVLKQLEQETKLSWQTQTEDLNYLNESARKCQLVIRHRLTEAIDEILDQC